MTDRRHVHDRRPFGERLKDSVLRGTERARTLIQRVRAAVGADTGAYPEESRPPLRSDVAQGANANATIAAGGESGATPATAATPASATSAASAASAHVAPTSTSEPTSGAPGSSDTLAGIGSSWARWDVPGEFVTLTMAQILMRQGRFRDARRVLERLAARQPSDPQVRATLARCDELAREQGLAAPADSTNADAADAEPSEMLDRAPPPRHYGRDEVRTLPVDPGTIAIFWELTDATVSLAKRDFDGPAHLAILVLSHVRVGGAEHREARWVDWVPTLGDYFVRGLPADATHDVAVGLRGSDGMFVPIVQADSADTPRGRPALQGAEIRATVALPAEREPESTTRIVEVRAPGGVSLPVGVGVEETLLAWAALGRGMPPAFAPYEEAIASRRGAQPSRTEVFAVTHGETDFDSQSQVLEESTWEWVPADEWIGESTSSGQWKRTRSRTVRLPGDRWSEAVVGDWPSSPGGPVGTVVAS